MKRLCSIVIKVFLNYQLKIIFSCITSQSSSRMKKPTIAILKFIPKLNAIVGLRQWNQNQNKHTLLDAKIFLRYAL